MELETESKKEMINSVSKKIKGNIPKGPLKCK